MTVSTTRLHITPLTPESLSSTLGSSLVQIAQNVSYHTLQTFPENSYGFLDLPTADAEKLKKRLNDAILRGRKMKVDEARPKKRRRLAEEEEDTPPSTDRKIRKSNSATHKVDTIEGRDLSPARKIKRGWTEPKSEKIKKKSSKIKDVASKSQAPSKYTEKEELLFRTKIPPNRKEADKDNKKKTAKKRGNDLVHEFEKATIQPSFLRDRSSSNVNSSTEYQDGRGWVDGDGNVVEEESGRVAKRRNRTSINSVQVVGRELERATRNMSGDSESSSTDDDDSSRSSHEGEENRDEAEDETSSSGTSSSESDQAKQNSTGRHRVARPKTAVPVTGQSSNLQEETSGDSLHPLEALFKKPRKPFSSQDVAKPSLEIETSFSFFDQLQAEGKGEDPVAPATPFTSQDLRTRGIRSAAPTPDTAHPSRFNSYSGSLTPEPIEEGDEDSSDTKEFQDVLTAKRATATSNPSSSDKLEPSEFEKKFWERRGENNRAWKARRKAALKEKRQRENRLRRPRNW